MQCNDSVSKHLDYTEWLFETGEIHQYLIAFVRCLRIYPKNSIPEEKFETFVDRLYATAVDEPIGERLRNLNPDIWSCTACWGVLVDPITLLCGHSFCKRCLIRSKTCSKCGFKSPIESKVNVAVNTLVHKYWDKELKAVNLRNEGNELFNQDLIEQAIARYNLAYELNPKDPLLLSNRSHAYFHCNNFESALRDAEAVITLRPNWAKAFYRHGKILRTLGRTKEAFKVIYRAVTLDKNGSSLSLRTELSLILSELIDNSDDDETLIRLMEEETVQASTFAANFKQCDRDIDLAAVDHLDYECPLCFRLFWQPITTPCGHTYCKTCLDRFLDHQAMCAMCKFNLVDFLASRRDSVCEFIEKSMERVLSDSYAKRKKAHEQEVTEMLTVGDIPIFICTISYPGIPCPLHVYEPKYRLMIRRCMESGRREFGMCSTAGSQQAVSFPQQQQNHHQLDSYSEYGTILEIRHIEYFPDGRAVVDTVGSRRFKILSRGTRDGYNVATVDYISDCVIPDEEVKMVEILHDETYEIARNWFLSMRSHLKEGILTHYGTIPEPEKEYWKSPNGPSWMWWILAILPLDQKTQVKILAQTSILKRLESIQKILKIICKNKE